MRTRIRLATASLAVSGAMALALVSPAAADQSVTADTQVAPSALAGWSAQTLAPGARLYSGVVGHSSAAEYWTVTVRIPTISGGTDPNAPVADLGSQQAANALADRVRGAGFTPRVEVIDWPAYADTPRGPLGWRVRVGQFADKAQATGVASAIAGHGFKTSVDWTGLDGSIPGQSRVRVAVIDPHHFAGNVVASHGATVAGRQTTSAQAADAGALLGVNGGFFIISPSDGIPGTPAGIGVYNGQLQREATNGRVALVLGDDGRHPQIDTLTTHITVWATTDDGRPATRDVNGINRYPGIIRNCGEPGDQPTDRALHDMTCTNPNELVLITPELGGTSPNGPGIEAVLDADGQVTQLRPRGGPVPAGGNVVQGIGDGAAWLNQHVSPGTTLHIDEQATTASGRRVPLDGSAGVLGGGPWLVHNSKMWIDATADGIVHPGDASFTYAWALKRNPRTMVGIDRSGRLLVVTVDGRQPSYSEGFSLTEAAQFLQSLGAVEALNLDGGGSTAMAVNGALVNSPSDATGERPVGDTLLVLPRQPERQRDQSH